MKALILAAGRGSRLGALTNDLPKCLVPFNGRSLLERCMTSLRKGGVSDIGIITGYRSELLQGWSTHLFHDPEQVGIFNSLRCAEDWLRTEPCLVSYSDIFFGSKIVTELIQADAELAVAYDPNAVLLWKARFTDPLSDIESFEVSPNGYLNIIGGSPASLASVNGQYMGLLKIKPSGWKALEEAWNALTSDRKKSDLTKLLSRIIQRIPILGIPNDEPWGEIDNFNDLKLYENLYPHV